MKSRILLFAALLTGCLFFTGCEIFEEALSESFASEDPTSEDYDARFVIGIFSIVRYPRATALEREVNCGDGTTIWINANQNFSSKRIRAARAIPRPGNPDRFDLEIRLDRMGKSQWQTLGHGNRGEPVVMMVDNRFVGTFVPEASNYYNNMEWVKIRIGMDSYTAKGIVKFAKKNYSFYNPNASDWFSSLF